MTVSQIEKILKEYGIWYEVSYSNKSKSEYIKFDTKNGDVMEVRISNHDLPISYQGRNFDQILDYRFSDSFTDFKKNILLKVIDTTNKITKTKKKIDISEETIDFLLSEIVAFSGDVEKVFRIYGINKKEYNVYKKILGLI